AQLLPPGDVHDAVRPVIRRDPEGLRRPSFLLRLVDPTRPSAVPERYHLDTVPSSNDVILRYADAGAAEHTMVVAREQTAARGGSGPWLAPPGGLWLTTLWRPDLDACSAALLTLASGWGVREGVRRATGVAAGLKWPNDLVVEGKKLGGILVEGRVHGHDVVAAGVGVGINANNPLHAFPPPVARRATSLQAITARDVDMPALLESVAQGLREARALLASPAQVVRAFGSCWTQKGQEVRLDTGHTMIEGRAERIDADGCLVVRTLATEHRVDDTSLAKFVRVV
ncbi:MAG: biotin--[acetyl-CoA-carboxylase] ligase, partial [Myxococcota bacterium]